MTSPERITPGAISDRPFVTMSDAFRREWERAFRFAAESGHVWMTCVVCAERGEMFTSTVRDLTQASRIAEEHFAAKGPHSGGGDAP